jgi:histidyl-tRNA synthetase
VVNHRLVRGLDYYVRTTFEVVSDKIGAQGTVAGGGRYDGLVEQLGGPKTPGLGFACGMERLCLLLPQPEPKRPDFYVAVLAEEGREAGFMLTQALRDAERTGEMGFAPRSMKSAMRQAGKSGARYTLIIGQDEAASGTVAVKDMDTGEQITMTHAEALTKLTA